MRVLAWRLSRSKYHPSDYSFFYEVDCVVKCLIGNKVCYGTYSGR